MTRLAVRYALDNIYCAPGQDKQFCFKMVRFTKKAFPARSIVSTYSVNKRLPNDTSLFHVFALGNISPVVLNLLSQGQEWFRDAWINVATDMVARNYILKVYSQDGLMYPRCNVYYSFTDESSLLIALEVTPGMGNVYPCDTFEYLSVYSNSYFNGPVFNSLPSRVGIDYRYCQVNSNLEKVALQSYVAGKRAIGGDVFVYVNGYFTGEVKLDIPDGSYVELLYDQSLIGKEVVAIPGLRTFGSTLDSRTKYLLFRDKVVDCIQYEDDAELYVTTSTPLFTRGLYFYKHESYVMRNVTDKDFSVDATYVNNMATRLNELVAPGVDVKTITLYTRKSGRDMSLVHSAIKLHELYKLPDAVQLDVINNTGFTLDLYRAENLENSDYFKVASSPGMRYVTPELATSAVGYNGLTYNYANTPNVVTKPDVDVPELYQWNSLAFEYSATGLLTSYGNTAGALYPIKDLTSGFVSFMKGKVPIHFGRLYDPNETISIDTTEDEVVFLSCYYTNGTRQSNWEDITNTGKVVKTNSTITLNEDVGKKVKLVNLSEINVYEEEMTLVNGALYFPITQREDRGSGVQKYPCETKYRDIAIFLNGRRLTDGIDYLMSFPNVCIFSKKYIDYTLPAQKVLLRCSGYIPDSGTINALDVKGFVNNGALTRNNYYDIRDDRVYAVYVDGLMKDKSTLLFSEEDNTVRLNAASNGLPYVLEENFIPIKFLTGMDTTPLYNTNVTNNKKIAALYNLAYPEPAINEFDIIGGKHQLFSPTISKMINDIVTGALPDSVFTTPYNDNTINDLLGGVYKPYLMLDPIKLPLPPNLVEIHPHIGNTVVPLGLLAYRFLSNVVRLITNNKPERINLSGYLAVA